MKYTFKLTLQEMKYIRQALEDEQFAREKNKDPKAEEYARLEEFFSRRIIEAMFREEEV